MPNNDSNNRVLNRVGARELSHDEVQFVAGAVGAHTNVCTALTLTNTGDGDACLDHD
jgi:hypothetical protein